MSSRPTGFLSPARQDPGRLRCESRADRDAALERSACISGNNDGKVGLAENAFRQPKLSPGTLLGLELGFLPFGSGCGTEGGFQRLERGRSV